MKLLEAEPAVAPAPDAQAPPEAAPAPPTPEGGSACKHCGAPMEAEQDWCLTCGTAAPGRLGQRPGWRAASTVIALTAVLVLGAIGAGYAAINDNGKSTPSTATQALTPPAATPPAATTTPPATATPPAATSTPSAASSKASKLPKVKGPKPSNSAGTPITPAPATTTPTETPSVSTPPATTPPASTPAATTPPAETTPSTPASTTTTPAGPVAIEVPAGAGKLYDPYHHVAQTDDHPEEALDGNPGTSWYVESTTPQQPGLGYAIDLGKKHAVRELDITTPTPGFKVEVYAIDQAQLPDSILDSRWAHIGNAVDVSRDEKVKLLDDATKYRKVLLWFTQQPKDGTRISLTGVQVLG